jgi:polysaccharide deacetylase family protein (PEP-CTERM system associated)
MPELRNALTVDVEDYFQVSALAPHIPRADWERMPCRVQRNVERILELLADSGAQATFFVLGWIAERYPNLVRAIHDAGHEVASHGYAHHRATEQSSEDFFDDIRTARAVLEDIAGVAVRGYRAPSFSVGKTNPWIFDRLVEAGYFYSSSVYPVRHDHYGLPHAPRFPYRPRPGLLEIPIATARLAGTNLPAGGGGYFRLLPYAISRALLRRLNSEGRAAVFYLHPWELDPDQPRIPGTHPRTRFRHYVNLHRTEPRLRSLLRDFAWSRIDSVFPEAHA